jgi:hypothetical protein
VSQEPLTDVARRLAELLDAALADDWKEQEPAMAVLWQRSDDPDDLRIAVKRLERSVEDELAPLDDGGGYLALAHSTVTNRPDHPVRITIAVDDAAGCGLVRHPNGDLEHFDAADLPLARLLATASLPQGCGTIRM